MMIPHIDNRTESDYLEDPARRRTTEIISGRIVNPEVEGIKGGELDARAHSPSTISSSRLASYSPAALAFSPDRSLLFRPTLSLTGEMAPRSDMVRSKKIDPVMPPDGTPDHLQLFTNLEKMGLQELANRPWLLSSSEMCQEFLSGPVPEEMKDTLRGKIDRIATSEVISAVYRTADEGEVLAPPSGM